VRSRNPTFTKRKFLLCKEAEEGGRKITDLSGKVIAKKKSSTNKRSRAVGKPMKKEPDRGGEESQNKK